MAKRGGYYNVLSYGQRRTKVYALIRETDGVILAYATKITDIRRAFLRMIEERGRPFKGSMFVSEHTRKGDIRIEELRYFDGLATYPFLGAVKGVYGDGNMPKTINRVKADGTLGAKMYSSDWEW